MIDPATFTHEEIAILRRLAADPKKVGLSDSALAAIGEIQRQAIKEGFKGWLDATYAAVGKWTLQCILFHSVLGLHKDAKINAP